MIEQHLINFSIVIVTQLLFFIIHAFFVKEIKNIGRYFLLGALVGIPFGIAFDLIIGLYLGIFAYTIGFPLWFLFINGLFSYGFMIANVFLLQNHTVHHMFIWSALLGMVYEVTNHLFPVWEWTFGTPLVEYGVVILFAYFGLAWMMMLVLQVLFGTQFKIVPFSFTLKAK